MHFEVSILCRGQQSEIMTRHDLLHVQENHGLVGQRRKRRADASDRVRDTAGEFVGRDRLQRDLET